MNDLDVDKFLFIFKGMLAIAAKNRCCGHVLYLDHNLYLKFQPKFNKNY